MGCLTWWFRWQRAVPLHKISEIPTNLREIKENCSKKVLTFRDRKKAVLTLRWCLAGPIPYLCSLQTNISPEKYFFGDRNWHSCSVVSKTLEEALKRHRAVHGALMVWMGFQWKREIRIPFQRPLVNLFVSECFAGTIRVFCRNHQSVLQGPLECFAGNIMVIQVSQYVGLQKRASMVIPESRHKISFNPNSSLMSTPPDHVLPVTNCGA